VAMECASKYTSYILYLFNLETAIKKTTENQKKWISQLIENANNVGRCIGEFNVDCASMLFKTYINVDYIYRSCYNLLFLKKKKKKAEVELSSGEEEDFEQSIYLSSGDEDDEVDIKPKLEEMEPCCSSSLKD
jgi:hypothetical protein